MDHGKTRTRRQARWLPCGEQLESRALLTGGAGSLFALEPGTIATPGGADAQTFTIDPAQFTMPRHSMVLGVDVAASTGATITPAITSVDSTATQTPLAVTRTTGHNAVLVPIQSGGRYQAAGRSPSRRP